MKSKITIDLDWDNQPIIKIEHIDSEDVRDKMIRRFVETFEYDGILAQFKCEGVSGEGFEVKKTYYSLRPSKVSEVSELARKQLNILNGDRRLSNFNITDSEKHSTQQ